MARRELEILERAVHAVTEQAAKADDLVDEAIDAGPERIASDHGSREDAAARAPEREDFKVNNHYGYFSGGTR